MNHEEVDQPPLKIHHLESNINKFISKTSDKEEKVIDMTVVNYFMPATFHLLLYKAKVLKNLINIMKPSYKLPSRKEPTPALF